MDRKLYLLIWDIDGTLIQGCGIGQRAMNKAFLELYNISDGFKGIDMAGRLDAVILKDAYAIHSIPPPHNDNFYSTYCGYLKKEVAIEELPIEAPGILKLLNKLSGLKNFYNVLGTGNIEDAARIKLEKHDMNIYFPTGGFGDRELERWHIIREAVIKAQQHFGVLFDKDNIYVIGDTPKDIECGKKLDIKSIGVATGSYSVRKLAMHNPDYVFENFSDTDKFLEIFGIAGRK